MKDHSECKRGFYRANRGVAERLMIGFYHPGGGTTGEFSIQWGELGGAYTPLIGAYRDAWSALHGFSDFLAKLAEHDGEDLAPEAVIALLRECGVEEN